MKKLKYFILIILFTGVTALSGCDNTVEKEKENKTALLLLAAANADLGSISFTKDEVTYTWKAIKPMSYSTDVKFYFVIFAENEFNNTANYIVLAYDSVQRIGGLLAYYDSNGAYYLPNIGFTLTVTQFNTRFKGTFSGALSKSSGTGPSSITLTEGSFDVAVQ